MTLAEKRRFEKLKEEIFKQVRISTSLPVYLKSKDFELFARINSKEDKPFKGNECVFQKITIKRAQEAYA